MPLPDDNSVNRLTDAVEKLVAKQESLLRNQAQITENHDLLVKNQVRGTENHDIVIRNQATIIKNQSIITQNQASILRNQELLIVNQAHLKAMLELQIQLLAAVTNQPTGEIRQQAEELMARTEAAIRQQVIPVNPRVI